MKCPHCGHWNRASLPRCFKCGAALTPPAPQPPVQNIQEQPPVPDVAVQTPAPAQKAAAPVSEKKAAKAPSGKTYIRYNEEGYATASVDDRDALARDMQSLQERKQKGLLVQQQLRQNSAQQGIAPTGRHVQSMTGRVDYPPFYKNLVIREEDEAEGDVRQDAIAVVSNRSSAQAEQETLDFTHLPSYSAPSVLRSRKNARSFGMGRYLRLFACLLLVIVLIGGGIWFISQHSDKDQKTLQDLVVIDNTIYNDVAAHRIKIPADEGAVIYIKELHRSYTVTGGYAIVEVEDYKWYEDLELAVEDAVGEEKEAAQKKLDELMQQESITATITPYIKSAGNVQKPMGQIQFNVEIPLSPLIVITPDTLMDETSTKQFVLPGGHPRRLAELPGSCAAHWQQLFYHHHPCPALPAYHHRCYAVPRASGDPSGFAGRYQPPLFSPVGGRQEQRARCQGQVPHDGRTHGGPLLHHYQRQDRNSVRLPEPGSVPADGGRYILF